MEMDGKLPTWDRIRALFLSLSPLNKPIPRGSQGPPPTTFCTPVIQTAPVLAALKAGLPQAQGEKPELVLPL